MEYFHALLSHPPRRACHLSGLPPLSRSAKSHHTCWIWPDSRMRFGNDPWRRDGNTLHALKRRPPACRGGHFFASPRDMTNSAISEHSLRSVELKIERGEMHARDLTQSITDLLASSLSTPIGGPAPEYRVHAIFPCGAFSQAYPSTGSPAAPASQPPRVIRGNSPG